MTTSVPLTDLADTSNLVQAIFTVKLLANVPDSKTGAVPNPAYGITDANGDFTNYANIVGHSAMTDSGDPFNPNYNPSASVTNIIPDPIIKQVLAQTGSTQQGVPTYFFSTGKCRDTSLGGNDAINCYPQFNETDDVADHPFLITDPAHPGTSGMGRVYSEVYDDQQQIMYITFGIPKFNNITSFYSGAILKELAQVMNSGGNVTANEIGSLLGEVIGTVVILPVLPLIWIFHAIMGLDEAAITKYYDFQSAMPLYYRCVNSMIIHIAVNMGLIQDSFFLLGGGNAITQEQQLYDNTVLEQDAINAANNHTLGLPEIFGKYGFDVYTLLLKKFEYINAGVKFKATESNSNTSDFSLANSTTGDSSTGTASTPSTVTSVGNVDVTATDGGTVKGFVNAFLGPVYDAQLYIGFRVEKGLDTSESFTNETGPSSIAQQVNSQIQQTRDTKFSFGNGNIGGALTSVLQALGGIVSGVASAVHLDNLDQIIAGNGMLDFPDVWKDSSFSKQYSFNMSLRTPYGDPVSILQNLYFPLALLLGGSLPRAVGNAAYTSPFICRAYCKGMFAITLGMITSITIKRGADQFGWNTARLPTCIDVSFQIKDLSPALYMGITDSGSTLSAIAQVFAQNSNYQEYLMTLSGMGLVERIDWLYQMRLKASYLLAQRTTTKLSPFYWGAAFGNTIPARAISLFVPATRIPSD